MGQKLISPKIDVVFKKFFTDNRDLLRDFISDILEIPIEEIEDIIITNPELVPDEIDGKFSRIDLNLKLTDRLVNIEVQIKYEDDYEERSLFYWAKLFTSELKAGEPYENLKQAITINIINFNKFDSDDYHTEVAAVIKGTNKVFSDKFKIHFFELKKVGKEISNSRRKMWMQFFNAEDKEEFDMLAKTENPTMKKAVRVILDYSEDTKIREMARQREKRLHDEASALAGAEKRGIAIGEKRGIAIGEERGIAIGEERGIAIGEERGIEKGINALIEMCEKFKMNDEEITEMIMDKFGVSKSEAEERISKWGKQ